MCPRAGICIDRESLPAGGQSDIEQGSWMKAGIPGGSCPRVGLLTVCAEIESDAKIVFGNALVPRCLNRP